MTTTADHTASVTTPTFDASFRATLHDLLVWRRDVRHFRRDPLPPGTLDTLLAEASLAPSVGLSQPWRFVTVDDPARRAAVRENFEHCNADALAAQPADRAACYARLKLAGLIEAPVHLAVFADRDTDQGHGLGRRTMPEMIEYSAVLAVHTLWLAARANGIGLGWVSILDPDRLTTTLDVPPHWAFIAYLCMGYAVDVDDVPALERAGWERRRTPDTSVLTR
jgi:5,6-dimethylbenzimidazole synthase